MIRLRSNRMSRLLAGLATAVLSSAALAQGATISGTVKNGQGQVLQAANVRIENITTSVGTDADGVYRISVPAVQVRGQTVWLTVRAIGYRPQAKQITLGTGSQDHDFMLVQDVNRVSEVVVSGSQIDTVRTSTRGDKQLAYTVTKYGQDTIRTPGASDFSQHLFPPELIMQNQGRLRITEQQRDAILQEIYKVQATAAQVQWRVSDESEKLNQLLERENASESEVLAQADRMMNWETAVKRAQLTMLIRIRNLLTPEQKAMLQGMRLRRE